MTGTEKQIKFATDLLNNLKSACLDIPGDMCETKAMYIENTENFFRTINTENAPDVIEALDRSNSIFDIHDIREFGADFWSHIDEICRSNIRKSKALKIKA